MKKIYLSVSILFGLMVVLSGYQIVDGFIDGRQIRFAQWLRLFACILFALFAYISSTRSEEELRQRLIAGKENQDRRDRTADKIVGYLIGITIVVLIIYFSQDR